MTVLSKPSILKALEAKRIIIDPFELDNLNPNSYDVTLGLHYGRMVGPALRPVSYANKTPELAVVKPAEWVNPFSKDHWDQMWETFEGIEVDYLQSDLTYKFEDFSGLTPTDRVMVIEPGETILAHTEEFIGSACDNITTLLKTKSSLARCFVSTSINAGWGDIGFHNRWTLQITNHNLRQRILLKVGMKVAQIAFIEVSEPVRELYQGKYQQVHESLEDLKQQWKTEDMLPKLWKHVDKAQ